jgi:hypothetical protein
MFAGDGFPMPPICRQLGYFMSSFWRKVPGALEAPLPSCFLRLRLRFGHT